jgi:hypothetical protein
MASSLDAGLFAEAGDFMSKMARRQVLPSGLTNSSTKEGVVAVQIKRLPPFGPSLQDVEGAVIEHDDTALISFTFVDDNNFSLPINVCWANL